MRKIFNNECFVHERSPLHQPGAAHKRDTAPEIPANNDTRRLLGESSHRRTGPPRITRAWPYGQSSGGGRLCHHVRTSRNHRVRSVHVRLFRCLWTNERAKVVHQSAEGEASSRLAYPFLQPAPTWKTLPAQYHTPHVAFQRSSRKPMDRRWTSAVGYQINVPDPVYRRLVMA